MALFALDVGIVIMEFEWGQIRSVKACVGAVGLMAFVMIAPAVAVAEEAPPQASQPQLAPQVDNAPQAQGFWSWLQGTNARYEAEVRRAERVTPAQGDSALAGFLGSLNGMTRQATAWIKAWIPGAPAPADAPVIAKVEPPPPAAPAPVPEEAVFYEPGASKPVAAAAPPPAASAEVKPADPPAVPLTPKAQPAAVADAPAQAEDPKVPPARAAGPEKPLVVADASSAPKSREEALRDEIARRRAEADRQISEGLKKLEEFEAARKARDAAASADAEAKAKADAEAKARKEAEDRAKAEDAKARAKAEADAKAKAETEARAKDEAARLAKAEADARAKAEAEAKAVAEAAAKAEAERLEKAEVAAALNEKPLSEADKKAIDDAVMATARELDRAEEIERQGESATEMADASPGPRKPEIITREPENELKPASRPFAFGDASGGSFERRAPTAAAQPRLPEPEPRAREPIAEDEPMPTPPARRHSFADAEPERMEPAPPVMMSRAKALRLERIARKQRIAAIKAKREARRAKVRRNFARYDRPRVRPVERYVEADEYYEERPVERRVWHPAPRAYMVAPSPHMVVIETRDGPICVPRRRARGLFVLE